MQAVQINKYAKSLTTTLVDVPCPPITAHQVLVQVKVAAVNPLDIMNINGSVRLIQDYAMPLTLGNELTGIVTAVGTAVTDIAIGTAVYTRLPLTNIGAFAEYVAVAANAVSPLPANLDFETGAAAALTGLTAYQALTEIFAAHAGQTVFITGGSGSFGQLAIPIAKHLGLHVITSGNAAAQARTLAIGADQYFDYRTDNYWEHVSNVDFVIDTVGAAEFAHELAIIKPGGQLLSLKAGPNKRFAKRLGLPGWKQFLFGLVGAKFDRLAAKHDVTYDFLFVRAAGEQLATVTQIIEANNIVPVIDPTPYTLETIDAALDQVANGRSVGKVIVSVS